jgi:hypothetical protein
MCVLWRQRSDNRGDDGAASAAAGDAIFERLRVQLVAKLRIPEYQEQNHKGQMRRGDTWPGAEREPRMPTN